MRGWRRLHNEERPKFYASPNILRMMRPRRMRWAGHVAHMGEMRNASRILVGRSEGKRPLGTPRCRWEDIRVVLRVIGWEGMDWILLDQDRDQWWAVVNTVMKLGIP
jgi:hypothetical protein